MIAEAYKKGMSALREVALKMSPPVKPGEKSVSLEARIQAQSPQR